MENCILVTPDGVFKELELDLSSCEAICEAIGCSFFEIVRTPVLTDAFSDTVVMVVDDMGALNDSRYNEFASNFYPGQIFGNALFVKEEAGDFVPLVNEKLIACWFAGECGLSRSDDQEGV